jgi:hypothetical protein
MKFCKNDFDLQGTVIKLNRALLFSALRVA